MLYHLPLPIEDDCIVALKPKFNLLSGRLHKGLCSATAYKLNHRNQYIRYIRNVRRMDARYN